MNSKKLKAFFFVIMISICVTNTANANIIDKFMDIFGISNETISDNYNTSDDINFSDIEINLDDRQKEVVAKIEEIYSYIQNINIAGLEASIDYKISAETINNLEQFLLNYKDSANNLKSILGTIKYKIVNVRNDGDKVIAKITYTYPSIAKLIKKVLPEIILKNAGILFGGQINNDVIDSALESIKKELDKGTYEVEMFTREFAFAKFGDYWKVIEVEDIVNDATKYVNEIGKSFFK